MRPFFKFFLLPILLILIALYCGAIYRYYISTYDDAKVIVGKRVFSIPKNYIGSGKRIDVHPNGVLLRGRDDFQYAKPDTDIRDQVETKMARDKYYGILLKNPKGKTDIPLLMQRTLAKTYVNTSKLLYQKQENEVFDLVKYIAFPYPEQTEYATNELYIELDKKKLVSSYIRCRPKVPFPGCSHYFVNNNVHYKFSFNYRELKNWKDNRKLIIEFIEEMSISE